MTDCTARSRSGTGLRQPDQPEAAAIYRWISLSVEA